MADLNKIISVSVDDNASASLNKIDQNITKVTQSTSNHTKSTESNTKSLLDNGGAMGLLNDATGGLAMTFKDAAEAIGLSGNSLKGLRGAIIATGIGALAIILLELITNWDKWVGLINGSTAALEELNKQRVIFEDQSRSNLFILDDEIAKLQETLRLYEAQGKSEKELNAQRELIRLASVKYYQDEIKILDELIDKELEYYSSGIGTEEEREASFQRRREDERKRLDYQIQLNKLENDPAVLSAQKERQKSIEELNKSLGLVVKNYDRISQSLQKNLEEIKKVNASANEYRFDENGEVFNKLRTLSELWYTSQVAIANASKEVKELTKIYNTGYDTIIMNTQLNNDEKQKEIDKLKENTSLKLTELKVEQSLKNAILDSAKAREILSNTVNKTIDNVGNSDSMLQDYSLTLAELTTLEIELFNSQNKLFDFEKGFEKNGKWLDDRLNNSTKFEEIQRRINNNYILTEQLITKNFETQNKLDVKRNDELINRANESQREADRLTEKLAELRASGVDVNSEQYIQIAKEQNIAEAQSLDFYSQSIELKKSIDANYINYVKETSLLKSELEISTEANTIEQKRLMREEELERQRMYAEKSIAIAEETANFLDSIAALGGKKSQEFAKAALTLRKGAGVAQVVISTQEEIRGIWANPALTALPDTGITKKTLLTAAAAARSAVSIATILSQKINTSGGGGGASATGGGVGPQAQFNIVGSSQTNQLAATIGAQQNQPVNAYVVGTDVSTQQSLDRNRIQNATFL